jgi:hypothetical protein
MRETITVFVLLLLCSRGAGTQDRSPRAAVPIDPIEAIAEAFRSHSLIGISDAHANNQLHAFLLSLIRNPRIHTVIDDLVVESGNARFQDDMDRFMRGEELLRGFLRSVSHGGPPLFTEPMYEEFFTVVRDLNAALPQQRKLRVIMGESPTHRRREWFVANLIRREVLAKSRRALIIYGGTFFLRRDPSPYGTADFESIPSVLEGSRETKLFTVWVEPCNNLARIQRSISSWRPPALALIRGTPLGRSAYRFYNGFGAFRMKDGEPVMKNGGPVIEPPPEGLLMEDQFDAIIYLGPPRVMTYTDRPFGCAPTLQ